MDAAYGETNLIDLMKARLRLDEQEAQLVAAIDAVSSSLQTEVDAVLKQAIGDIELSDSRRETAVALQAAHSGQSTRDCCYVPIFPLEPLQTHRLTSCQTFVTRVATDVSGMRQGLDTLGEVGYGAAVAHMYSEVDRFESNVERIHNGRPELAAALTVGGTRAPPRPPS